MEASVLIDDSWVSVEEEIGRRQSSGEEVEHVNEGVGVVDEEESGGSEDESEDDEEAAVFKPTTSTQASHVSETNSPLTSFFQASDYRRNPAPSNSHSRASSRKGVGYEERTASPAPSPNIGVTQLELLTQEEVMERQAAMSSARATPVSREGATPRKRMKRPANVRRPSKKDAIPQVVGSGAGGPGWGVMIIWSVALFGVGFGLGYVFRGTVMAAETSSPRAFTPNPSALVSRDRWTD